MLIQFDESTRAAYGATSDCSRLDMREGASRNPAIQLRASCQSEAFHPVASSRVEETTTHSISVPGTLVGQRGGRLSESSPADRHRAAPAGQFMAVQGEHPSHPFIAALRDFAAIASAILLITATGIGFTAAIYLLLFVSL